MDFKKIYQDYLIDTISNQCKSTKTFIDKYRSVFANNRNIAGFNVSAKELIFTMSIRNAIGSHFKDVDGNEYLDMSMGFGVHLFGHRPVFIEEAIRNQLEKGITLGPIFEDASKVAQLIYELTDNERCAFYNSGTEAVMVAMRIARAATEKNKIVIFEGSYHGTHDSLLGIKTFEDTHVIHSTLPGVTQSAVNETLILQFGNEQSLSIIRERANEIAGVLTEPVMSRHPELKNEDFLQKLRIICFEENIALIFDEVITGFRAGNRGAAGLFGIKPDIITYGKIVGGGIPIGIVAGKSRFMDMIDGGQWQFGDFSEPQSRISFTAGTFNNNPLAMAAAKSILQLLKDRQGTIQEELNVATKEMCDTLNRFFVQEVYPLSMVYFVSLFRFLIKGPSKLIFYSLLKEKIYIWEGRNCFLSTAHSVSDIDFFIKKVKQSCYELEAAGLLHSKRHFDDVPESIPLLAGIRVNKLLDNDKLAYACRYLFIAIPALKKSKCIITINSSDNQQSNNGLAKFIITIPESQVATSINVSADRNICDGWSLILFFRYLSKTYNALVDCLPLPEIKIEDEISPLINFDKDKKPLILKASSIRRSISLETFDCRNVKNLFTFLLTCFQKTLEREKDKLTLNIDKISVPVAGQIQYRKLKAFGQYTLHKEVFCNEINKEVSMNALYLLSKPITNHDVHSHAEIVFNLDNLDLELEFDGEKALFMPLDESETLFPLVCNVTQMKSGLLISLKFVVDRIATEEANHLLQSYINCIKKNASENIRSVD